MIRGTAVLRRLRRRISEKGCRHFAEDVVARGRAAVRFLATLFRSRVSGVSQDISYLPNLFCFYNTASHFSNNQPVLSASERAEMRQLLNNIASQLGISSKQHWYPVDSKRVHALDSRKLITKKFGGSVPRAIMDIFPEHEWLPWLFRRMPNGLWGDLKIQRQYFDWLGIQLHIGKNLEQWYSVSTLDVTSRCGTQLLQRIYQHSLSAALKAIYPDHEWQEWRFTVAPRNYWKEEKTRREYFDFLAKQLGVRDQEGNLHLDRWYKVTRSQVVKLGGSGVLKRWDNSLAGALLAIYPGHDWAPWKFENVPSNWWMNVANQRRFFEAIRIELGVRSMDDWYNVSGTAVQALGANGLMPNHYRGSIVRALLTVYPEHAWDPWRFARVSADTWRMLLSDSPSLVTQNLARRYLEGLAERLQVKDPMDWLVVPAADIERTPGSGMLKTLGGIAIVLKMAYPDLFGGERHTALEAELHSPSLHHGLD